MLRMLLVVIQSLNITEKDIFQNLIMSAEGSKTNNILIAYPIDHASIFLGM